MNILHYSLGFPPYRSGGLTKFCMDLMKEQVKEGNRVSLLWPGEIQIFSKSTKIKKNKSIKDISNYEVINPTPVPYDEGIFDISEFIAEGDLKVYEQFLKTVHPDIIHIHTFMGLHKNFLVAARNIGIKTVFTTHDFFPICPKVMLFRDGMICPDAKSCDSCPKCNLTALSLKKMQILQSPVYRTFKDNLIVKKIRKTHRDEYLSVQKNTEITPTRTAEEYRKLRDFYKSFLDLVNIVHYNSTITKEVYEKYMGERKSVLIPITHGDIQDHRKKKKFLPPLKITYLGPMGEAKGFFCLKAVLDDLNKERNDFILNVFFHKQGLPHYIKQHDRYSYSQLESIMDKTDVLITPSVWNETFGYTVIEAMSYGVPVIVSNQVGAKDVIPKGAGFIVNNKHELTKVVESLNIKLLESMNQSIIESFQILTMNEFNRILLENLQQ